MDKKKKVVIALGGNALGGNLPEQMEAVKTTSKAIVDLLEEGCQVVVTHGNGPQVGMINNAMAALGREDAKHANTPLSVCVAMSQAYIGYDLQNALREEMVNRGIDMPVMTVVTQVRVDENDPGFKNPTKPIGQFMTKEEAEEAEKNLGYKTIEDSGRGYRRVVASPNPLEIVELKAIDMLSNDGTLVISCGGGGIPVVREGAHLRGAGAVIDKDKTSALLAQDLDADMLIILTAVEKVAINFGKPDQQELDDITVAEAEKYLAEGQFPAGSMGPKVESGIAFAKSKPGRVSLITLLEKAKDGIKGKTGTRISQ